MCLLMKIPQKKKLHNLPFLLEATWGYEGMKSLVSRRGFLSKVSSAVTSLLLLTQESAIQTRAYQSTEQKPRWPWWRWNTISFLQRHGRLKIGHMWDKLVYDKILCASHKYAGDSSALHPENNFISFPLPRVTGRNNFHKIKKKTNNNSPVARSALHDRQGCIHVTPSDCVAFVCVMRSACVSPRLNV